jgi:outer membrane protein assembly factor BamB
MQSDAQDSTSNALQFKGHPLQHWIEQAADTTDPEKVKATVAALADAVRADDSLAKVKAADALAAMGPLAKDAVPAMLAQLGHEVPGVRVAMMSALAAVGPEAVAPLVEHFQTQTGGPRIRAAFVLGGMGDTAKPAVPVLAEAMRNEDPVVQKRLADILSQIDPENFAGNTTKVRVREKVDLATTDLVSATSNQWPQFNGPNRDRICTEKGLLDSWPEGGPRKLWSVEGMGRGFSTISIAGGRWFTMGDLADEEGDEAQYVLAYDLNSRARLWATEIGEPFKTGPRCTPTVHGDRVYALGTEGDLVCLEVESGKPVWHVNLADDFGGKLMTIWKYSESPLVDGDRVICTPGGEDAEMVALNKFNGDVMWKCAIPELGKLGLDGAGYSSAIVATIDGTRQYIQLTGRGVIGVEAETGEFLWGYNQIANNVANIPTPIARGPYVFVSTAYSTGSALLKIQRQGQQWQAEEIYYLGPRDFQNHHGGMVLVGNHVYGGSGPNRGTPTCIDLTTGKVCWQERAPARGSAAVLYADGNLIFRYDRGEVVLIEATPEEMRVKGQFKCPDQHDAWAHPVIFQGKLYLRYGDVLSCYDLRAL